MKRPMINFFLLVLLGYTPFAFTKRFSFDYPEDRTSSLLKSLDSKHLNNFNAKNILKKAKYLLVNGNINGAKLLLNESNISVNFTKATQYRYLALIHFIEGNYKKTVEILNKPEMRSIETMNKVCFLRVLSEIILSQREQASISWKNCRNATQSHSDTDLAWMEIIVALKTSNNPDYANNIFKELAIDSVEPRFFRIYLKLALYLNKQDLIINRFKYLSSAPFENETHRELIGLNYYRNGNLNKAHQLLHDLSTANSEVFKGNLYLTQKKYTHAYAQYKLALNKKKNSRNALNRLLPLSWKLNQFEDGITFLQSMEIDNDEILENKTLITVFLTMMGKYDIVSDYLKQIETHTLKGESIEISQLRVLHGMEKLDIAQVENAAARGCAGHDGLNCWLIVLINSWESVTTYLKNKDKIHHKLKSLTDELIDDNNSTPLVEEPLIQQKHIEELDNNLIILN